MCFSYSSFFCFFIGTWRKVMTVLSQKELEISMIQTLFRKFRNSRVWILKSLQVIRKAKRKELKKGKWNWAKNINKRYINKTRRYWKGRLKMSWGCMSRRRTRFWRSQIRGRGIRRIRRRSRTRRPRKARRGDQGRRPLRGIRLWHWILNWLFSREGVLQ